jgi:hypothetical protein
MGTGDLDKTVPCEVGEVSSQALKKIGFTNVAFTRYKDFKHWIVPQQFDELEAFASREVPQFPKPIPAPIKVQRKSSKCSADSTEEGSARSDSDHTDDERANAVQINTLQSSLLVQQGIGQGQSPPTRARQSSTIGGDTMQGYVTLRGCASPGAAHRMLNNSHANLDVSMRAAFRAQRGSMTAAVGGASCDKSLLHACGSLRGGASAQPQQSWKPPQFAAGSCSRSPTRFRRTSNLSYIPSPNIGSKSPSLSSRRTLVMGP